jgi:hypothetical protein
MDYSCPECGSTDLDISPQLSPGVECQECGWDGALEDCDTGDYDEPTIDDEPPPDVGSHPGAIIREWE